MITDILNRIRELHDAMRTHGDDSPEAEAIRDSLDEPFHRLTPEERQRAQDYSEQLYREAEHG